MSVDCVTICLINGDNSKRRSQREEKEKCQIKSLKKKLAKTLLKTEMKKIILIATTVYEIMIHQKDCKLAKDLRHRFDDPKSIV